MGTNKQIVLEEVYAVVQRQGSGYLEPTFSISGESDVEVNVYFYIKATPADTAPTDITEMVVEETSPFVPGVYPVTGNVDYVAFEKSTGTGTPVINTKNLIK